MLDDSRFNDPAANYRGGMSPSLAFSLGIVTGTILTLLVVLMLKLVFPGSGQQAGIGPTAVGGDTWQGEIKLANNPHKYKNNPFVGVWEREDHSGISFAFRPDGSGNWYGVGARWKEMGEGIISVEVETYNGISQVDLVLSDESGLLKAKTHGSYNITLVKVAGSGVEKKEAND